MLSFYWSGIWEQFGWVFWFRIPHKAVMEVLARAVVISKLHSGGILLKFYSHGH